MQEILTQLNSNLASLSQEMQNLTSALQKQAPLTFSAKDWQENTFAIWKQKTFIFGKNNLSINLDDLYGIEDQKQDLETNMQSFLQAKPYNHILITGARGMGKSSLVAGILQKYQAQNLRLIQVGREEFGFLPELFAALGKFDEYKFIVFFDDLAFERNDAEYKNLKSTLDNGLNLIPQNVCIIATSNRKHLIPESMADNLESINQDLRPSDTIEETISLSDRFGLWLSFYGFNQADYLEVVKLWLEKLSTKDQKNQKNQKEEKEQKELKQLDEQTQLEAMRFAIKRGVRNGRIAKHFAVYWLAKQDGNF